MISYFEKHKDQFVKDLAMLVAIDSQRGEPKPGMPYGEGPSKALASALNLAESYGLYTENWDNRLGIVQLEPLPSGERSFDILAHLDVVPAGEGWTITTPFDMKVDGSIAYGRGTSDDKGPALAAIYALRYMKEKGLTAPGGVRLVLGCDEECGSSDLDYYFTRCKAAKMSISPDADYPLINIEKGVYIGTLEAQCGIDGKLPQVISALGGEKFNVVPAKASAVVRGMTGPGIVEYIKTSGIHDMQFTVRPKGDDMEIITDGKSVHASMPEGGHNAVTALLSLLNMLPLGASKTTDAIKWLASNFPYGEFNGKSAGLYMKDDISGEITVCLDVLSLDENGIKATFDSRMPVNVDEAALEAFASKADTVGFVLSGRVGSSHHVSEDSLLVQTLLGKYEEHFGVKNAKPLAIGGGTYVHGIENGVAFGCALPEVDNHMHGPDEFVDIDVLLKSCGLFVDVICELCR